MDFADQIEIKGCLMGPSGSLFLSLEIYDKKREARAKFVDNDKKVNQY